MIKQMHELDFIFLSYDEPNAELLYANLLNMVPWSKRVHGIKGFDTAHKKCAEVSDTELFITVDGDNLVHPNFLDLSIDIPDDQLSHAWSWSGRNNVNGLVYGNGGLKLWSKSFVMDMKSHEHSQDAHAAVDFCWNSSYHDLPGCYSTSIINSTAKQAWRSGFREGIKMSLDQGQRVSAKLFQKSVWPGNIKRLSIWCSVGQDVEHGAWAIYGARMGCHLATMTDDDHLVITDYDQMDHLWSGVSEHDPVENSQILGQRLADNLGLSVSLLSAEDSAFFKSVYVNPPRSATSWDIVGEMAAVQHV